MQAPRLRSAERRAASPAIPRDSSVARLPGLRNHQSVRIQGSARSGRGTPDLIDESDFPNPFSLPHEDVFMMREREKQEKYAEKKRQAGLKIWEKNSDRTRRFRSSRQRYGIRMPKPRRGTQAAKQDRVMFQGHRKEKENMSEFIRKKREMFLTQMSLDTKREEIEKLEEKANMKEDALKKSEFLLEEDALRFGDFLKAHDQKAHKALRDADEETQKKQAKLVETKKLTQELSKLENDHTKFKETLDRCEVYKKFLDNLSPPEFIEQREKKRAARNAERTARHEARAAERQQFRARGLPEPEEQESEEESSDEELYFKNPDELLEMFTQLERRCLVLIEKSQESEEGLEELRTKMDETRTQMREKTNDLEQNIHELQSKIQEEEAKQQAYLKRQSTSTVAQEQIDMLEALNEKVREVYARVGFAEAAIEPLVMLREMEGWLEYLIWQIQILKEQDPTGKILEAAETAKKDKRREERRTAQADAENKAMETRMAKSNLRSKTEVVRRSGKAVMFRSPPLRRKKKKEEIKDEGHGEREELLRFFT